MYLIINIHLLSKWGSNLTWNWRCQKVYSVCNCKIQSVTLKVKICSGRVPSLSIRWRHLYLIQSVVLVCCVIFAKHRRVIIASLFIPFSSTATSSTTNENVALLERVGWNEEPASRNEDRTRNKPSSAPKMYLNDVQWNLISLQHAIMCFYRYFM